MCATARWPDRSQGGNSLRRANVVSGVVLAVFGIAMLFAIIPWQIEPGPQGMMSPRLVPGMMMAFVTVLAALLVINNLRAEPDLEGDVSPISRGELLALIRIGAIFALSVALFSWVSPLAAGAVVVAGSLLVLGERRPWMILGMPVLLLLALWFLFYKVLGTAIV